MYDVFVRVLYMCCMCDKGVNDGEDCFAVIYALCVVEDMPFIADFARPLFMHYSLAHTTHYTTLPFSSLQCTTLPRPLLLTGDARADAQGGNGPQAGDPAQNPFLPAQDVEAALPPECGRQVRL